MRIEVIGNSKLYLADCREVISSLGFDVVITDPPFGVTSHAWDKTVPESEWMLRAAVCFATEPFATRLINSSPLPFRHDLVWKKNTCITYNASNGPARSHERILVFGDVRYFAQKRQRTAQEMQRLNKTQRETYGLANPMSVLEFDAVNNTNGDRTSHPAQKPVDLMEWLVLSYSAHAATILDPFMGSGSTGVACARTGRPFIGIERDPEFFDIACDRVERAESQGVLQV